MSSRSLKTVLPPFVVFVVAWVTSPVSSELGVATVAVAVTSITLLSAFVSTTCGVTTSIVASLALNYFHTEPVHSLRIGSSADIVMVSFLGGVGLLASALANSRYRGLVRRSTLRTETVPVGDLLTEPRPLATAWPMIAADTIRHVIGVEVRLVDSSTRDLPIVSRPSPSALPDRDLVEIPEVGAVARFSDPRLDVAILFRPDAGVGSRSLSRRMIFNFVDLVETAIRADHDRS